MTTKLKELLHGEASSRSMTIEDDIVTVVHTVKPNINHQSRYQLSWAYDFTDVTRDELLLMATRPMLIKKQAAWREAKDRMDGDVWDNLEHSIRHMLDNARVAADPVTKASRAADKMDATQLASLIKALQAKQAADAKD